jgi:hypothetical protein
VRRQLTAEEQQALLAHREPGAAEPARLDERQVLEVRGPAAWSWPGQLPPRPLAVDASLGCQRLAGSGPGSRPLHTNVLPRCRRCPAQVAPGSRRLTPASMAHALVSWLQAWNLRSQTGSLEPLALEAILDPGFAVRDALGVHSHAGAAASWGHIEVGYAAGLPGGCVWAAASIRRLQTAALQAACGVRALEACMQPPPAPPPSHQHAHTARRRPAAALPPPADARCRAGRRGRLLAALPAAGVAGGPRRGPAPQRGWTDPPAWLATSRLAGCWRLVLGPELAGAGRWVLAP